MSPENAEGVHVLIVQGARRHPHDGWGAEPTIGEVLAALGAAGIDASTVVVGGASDLGDIRRDGCIAFPNARRFYDAEGAPHSLTDLLQEQGFSLVGSGQEGHAAERKAHMKRILEAHSILTPRWALISTESPHAADRLRFPVVVKPEAGSNSVGVQRVDEMTLLGAALEDVRDQFGPCDVLVEEWALEREFTIAVIGNGSDRQGCPVEIVLPANEPFLSAEVKRRLLVATRPVADPMLSTRLAELGVAACSALGVMDWGRVDVVQDASGDVHVIDTNTMPGLHRQNEQVSGFPRCLNTVCSMTYGESILAIVGVALLRHGLAVPGPMQAALAKLPRT